MKRRTFIAAAVAIPSALTLPGAKASDTGVIIRLTGSTAQIPEFMIGCIIKNSKTGAIIYDSREGTGKHLTFPQCVQNLTGEEKMELAEYIGRWFLDRYLREHHD